MMSDKLISQEELDALFWIVDRPKHAQEKEMDPRLAQYIEHCEAAFIKGGLIAKSIRTRVSDGPVLHRL